MDLTKEAIDRIAQLGHLAETQIVTIGGNEYVSGVTHDPLVNPPIFPDVLPLSTLSGVADAMAHFGEAASMVAITGPTNVNLWGQEQPEGRHVRRRLLAKAFPVLGEFKLGQFLPLEEFIIGLQVHFVADEPLFNVLRLLGNITDERVSTVSDDGVGQTVTAKAGIARVANVVVPNPVTLAMRRCFPEIEPPPGRFILRVRQVEGDLPHAALFDADAAAWRVLATDLIHAWLKERVTIPILR